MNKFDTIKKMTSYGLAGEEIDTGLIKTVYFARNGIFEKKTNSWVGSYLKKASDYSLNASSAVDELEETFELNKMEHKLPLKAFAAIYHFYKHIMTLNGNEAQINCYINEQDLTEITVGDIVYTIKDIPGVKFWSDKVFTYVPKQTNSSAQTSTVDPIYTEFRKTMRAFIETHSHNSMAAFKSGTDAANSDIEGLQLVFGKLGAKDTYDFKSWVTISGEQFDDASYEELSKFIDLPKELKKVRQLNGHKISKKLLKEWEKQCTFQVYTRNYPSYGYGYDRYKNLFGNPYEPQKEMNYGKGAKTKNRKKWGGWFDKKEDDIEYDFNQDFPEFDDYGYPVTEVKTAYDKFLDEIENEEKVEDRVQIKQTFGTKIVDKQGKPLTPAEPPKKLTQEEFLNHVRKEIKEKEEKEGMKSVTVFQNGVKVTRWL